MHCYKRYRKTCTSIPLAKSYIDQINVSINREYIPLDMIQTIEASKAIARLPENVSLAQVVDFWLRHNGGEKQMTVAEIAPLFLESKAAAGLKEVSMGLVRIQVKVLVDNLGSEPVATVTTQQLEAILDRRKYKGATRAGYRRGFCNFFNWCEKRGFVHRNPAKNIEKPLEDQKLPEILTVDQVAKIMAKTLEVNPQMIPYAAIGFFAGLRVSEIMRLSWDDVGKEQIRVTGKVRRSQRFVDIEPNLAQWLALADRGNPIVPWSTRRASEHFGEIRQAAGIAKWPKNAARHSYGSYHLALYESAAKTVLQMGNSEQVFFAHYRNLTTKAEAEKYFKICPKFAQEQREII